MVLSLRVDDDLSDADIVALEAAARQIEEINNRFKRMEESLRTQTESLRVQAAQQSTQLDIIEKKLEAITGSAQSKQSLKSNSIKEVDVPIKPSAHLYPNTVDMDLMTPAPDMLNSRQQFELSTLIRSPATTLYNESALHEEVISIKSTLVVLHENIIEEEDVESEFEVSSYVIVGTSNFCTQGVRKNVSMDFSLLIDSLGFVRHQNHWVVAGKVNVEELLFTKPPPRPPDLTSDRVKMTCLIADEFVATLKGVHPNTIEIEVISLGGNAVAQALDELKNATEFMIIMLLSAELETVTLMGTSGFPQLSLMPSVTVFFVHRTINGLWVNLAGNDLQCPKSIHKPLVCTSHSVGSDVFMLQLMGIDERKCEDQTSLLMFLQLLVDCIVLVLRRSQLLLSMQFYVPQTPSHPSGWPVNARQKKHLYVQQSELPEVVKQVLMADCVLGFESPCPFLIVLVTNESVPREMVLFSCATQAIISIQQAIEELKIEWIHMPSMFSKGDVQIVKLQGSSCCQLIANVEIATDISLLFTSSVSSLVFYFQKRDETTLTRKIMLLKGKTERHVLIQCQHFSDNGSIYEGFGKPFLHRVLWYSFHLSYNFFNLEDKVLRRGKECYGCNVGHKCNMISCYK